MDLIKKLTGKNPNEYETIAKELIDNANVSLYSKLVEQDDFLFDFVKNNVAKRIKKAINQNNYQNLLKFFDFYSMAYDYVIAEALFRFGGTAILPTIKNIFSNGSNEAKAYSVKYFSFLEEDLLCEILPALRVTATSDFEPLSTNSIEVLSKVNDISFKEHALKMLDSNDEFEQYNGVKYLVAYGADDTLQKIIDIMKHSSLSENIASEIPFLKPLDELILADDGILVLCNIVSAIPDIIPLTSVLDFNLYEIFEKLYKENLTSSSAVLLSIAQEKFEELAGNDEYLYDCDKNTKEEILSINKLLSEFSKHKLKNLLYDELYDESDFALFAVDFVDEKEELETLLDSSNKTLMLKVLSILKEKSLLTNQHKSIALSNIPDETLKFYIDAL